MSKPITTISTTPDQAGKDIIRIAEKYLGYDWKTFCNAYGLSYPEEWCVIFVWYVFKQAGLSKLFYDGQKTAYTPTIQEWCAKNCLEVSPATAKAGDICICTWGGGERSHTCLVRKPGNASTVYTIDGNSGTWKKETSTVTENNRNVSNIYAIYRPNYSGQVVKTSALTSTVASKDKDANIDEEQPTINIDYTKLTPYILTVDRNSPEVDYKLASKHGVVGVILEAGYLYTRSHQTVVFRNPKLYKQIEPVQSANLSFGYFMQGRAKTLAEAEKEMYELSFIVRKYPPILGVWIVPELTGDVKTNNRIINKYYTELVRLGLINKIGFYTTRHNLTKFTWDNFKDSWFLWLVEPVKQLTDINRLLDPEFFDVDGES